MNVSIIKCSLVWIFIGMLSLFIMLANLKPDMLKKNLESFINLVNFKETKKVVKESYIKKNDRYVEPSVFDQSQ